MKTYEIHINGELQPQRIVNCPSIEQAYSTWYHFNKGIEIKLKEYTGTDTYPKMFICCIM
mgnify:CR=1 FL=1